MDEDLKKALADLAERNATIGTLNVQIESNKTRITALEGQVTTEKARADKAEGTIVAMQEAVKTTARDAARNLLLTEAGFKLDDAESAPFIEAVRNAKDDDLARALIKTATGGRSAPSTPASSRQGHPALPVNGAKMVESIEQAEKDGLLKYKG